MIKKILKKILEILIHFIRRVLYWVTFIFVGVSCQLIFILTFEPKTFNRATIRKAKRIRFFTKLKLYCWKYGRWYFEFIHFSTKYLNDLYNNFSFLIDKK